MKRQSGVKEAGGPSPSDLIEAKIRELGDWRGRTLSRLRTLIRQADPEVVEELKWRGVPAWSHDGLICTGEVYKSVVKMTFARGAALEDPSGLFNASLEGNVRRAIDLHEGDELDERALKALIRAAVTSNSALRAKGKGRPAAGKPAGAAGGGTRASAATRREVRSMPAGPALLAGGNPQIAKASGDAPVQAYIAAMPDWKRDVGRRLDALIARTVPGVRKAVKWNSPFYGVEGQGWFLSFHCYTRHVKVAFFRGASLRPPPPGTSKHEEVRYLDIREGEPLDEKLLANWIRQASELPGWVP